VATELPLRYRKLVAKTSRCYVVVAGLWTAALVTFIAPLLTKPNWSYYRFNINQKMCGLHWEYPVSLLQRYHYQHYRHHRYRFHQRQKKYYKMEEDNDDDQSRYER